MTIYCVPKTDEVLFGEIGDEQSVLLVGCPICSNYSYCIQTKTDMPLFKLSLSGSKPVYVSNEVDRVSSLLQQKEKKVEQQVFNIPNALCGIDQKASKKVKKKAKNKDSIVTFSCDLGKERMEKLFPNIKVISAMNTVGIFGAPTIRKLNKFYLDHNDVNIKKFEYVDR